MVQPKIELVIDELGLDLLHGLAGGILIRVRIVDFQRGKDRVGISNVQRD